MFPSRAVYSLPGAIFLIDAKLANTHCCNPVSFDCTFIWLSLLMFVSPRQSAANSRGVLFTLGARDVSFLCRGAESQLRLVVRDGVESGEPYVAGGCAPAC